MKNTLPSNHGLPESVVKNLVFMDEGQPSLTDAQYSALDEGVGRGESLLVVSPTSTGKTQIGMWAIARSIDMGCNTVYLVTHRALAKQKFVDFKDILLKEYLDEAAASLVIATGDYVEDAEGEHPADPLRAKLLVATYEKYLALMSAAGVPKDMGNSVIICDEIQLLGDEHRGQGVEVLLTLLKNAGWKQFLGLSAVLQQKDATELANWLGVKLVTEHKREKHLNYECWTDDGVLTASTAQPNNIQQVAGRPSGTNLSSTSALLSLLASSSPPLPIIVFCMKKQDTYDLAAEFVKQFHGGKKGQLSLAFDGLPETSANSFLAGILEHRVASHNADLTDEERDVIESYLLEGKLDVVFATTTLAAGVNFPLGAAIFHSWLRWDVDKRDYYPIDAADFHNMAGRVGRMGFEHEEGRVIFFASKGQLKKATPYLSIGELPAIETRVTPERFNQLALQLVTSGLCATLPEVERLICSTFSALREEDKNTKSFAAWPQKIEEAVRGLVTHGFLLQTSTGRLTATPVGKAVGYSGLLPETGVSLLRYLAREAPYLSSLLPSKGSPGDLSKMAILLFSACFSSHEFRPQDGIRPTRYLPYPLKNLMYDADELSSHLLEPLWQADPLPINAAVICNRWIDGDDIRTLESTANNLSAGMLREMHRNLCWVLDGLAAIATAASDKRVPIVSRPSCLHVSDDILNAIAKLPRAINRLALRVQEGLPDNLLWMKGLCPPGSRFRLARHEILGLGHRGLSTPELLMLGSKEADAIRVEVFARVKPSPNEKANWIRDMCREWKTNQRTRAAERHTKRTKKCEKSALVENFYSDKGEAFERTFEAILSFLKIDFERLDDRSKTGAPDYLLKLNGSPEIVMELKSREGDKLVDYNKAVEVLSASEVHGHKNAFCVTLCHPGVDPSVPPVISACGRLSVVESTDLGEALIRLCEGVLSEQQLWQWLATPGQALSVDLPYREHGG